MSVLERTSIEREREKRIKTNSSYWLGSPLNHGLETLFLFFTVLHKQTQEWRDLRSLQFKARTEPSACHVTGSLFTHPVYRMPGWLGWLYTTTLCRLWQPVHVRPRCWATLCSWVSSLLVLSHGCLSPRTIPYEQTVPSNRLPHCARQLHSWQGKCWWLGTFFSKKNTDSSSSAWN